MTDYSKLAQALAHLKAQMENLDVSDSRTELTSLDREAIAESTIQRFETAYDRCWKLLKRHLTVELGLVQVPNSPKPIFRMAGQNGLVGDVPAWLGYADARVATAHDYSGAEARATLALIPAFQKDAQNLYDAMAGEGA